MTRTRADLQGRIRQQQMPIYPAPPVASVSSREGVPATQDRACLAVAHSAFDVPWILKQSRLLMDATGVTRRFASVGDTVMRL